MSGTETPTTPAQGEMRLVPVEPTEAMLEAAHKATPVTFLIDADPWNIWSAMLASAPSAPVVGREEIARLLLESTDDLATIVHSDPAHGSVAADRLAARIDALNASPAALSECLSALRAIKANVGDPEDVNRATCAIERVEGQSKGAGHD